MLTLQDELWIETNLNFLCFGEPNTTLLLCKTKGKTKPRIFLEIYVEVDRIHNVLVSNKVITHDESDAIKTELVNYLKKSFFNA